jgi:rhodanese-related sulfurtransferase
MSRTVQALMICAASLFGALLLAWGRGWPVVRARAAAPTDATVACEAPEAEPGAPAVQWISQAAAQALVGDPSVAFVDCRTRTQFEQGHVAGSLHVPVGADGGPSAAALDALRAATTVVTYCDAGGTCERSARMATLLTRAGLRDVRVLEGGMPAWLASGLPAESGTCRLCQDHTTAD